MNEYEFRHEMQVLQSPLPGQKIDFRQPQPFDGQVLHPPAAPGRAETADWSKHKLLGAT